MSLVTTAEVLTATKNTGAAPIGSELYAQFDQLRRMIESATKRWVKWEIEANAGMGWGNWIEYYDGKNYMDIALRKPWVSKVQQVLLNQLGAYGQYNQANAGFGGSTPLTAGRDYAPVFEQNGLCVSGLLRRLGNNAVLSGWWPSSTVYNRGAGGLAYSKGPVWPQGDGNVRVKYDWGFQPLTAFTTATWAANVGTITFASAIVARPSDQFTVSGAAPGGWNGDFNVASVSGDGTQITARIATDPGTLTTAGNADFIPLDIKAAVCQAVTIQRAQMQYGGRLGGEGLGDYNYSLNFAATPEFGSVVMMLRSYRDPAAGISLA